MVRNLEIPERGDVVWINFNPTRGHEQSGLRPSVVVSTKQYNAFSGLVLVCPMTSKRKDYFFEVEVKGPKVKSYVLSDQIKSFDIKERIKKITGKITMLEINEVLSRAATLFK